MSEIKRVALSTLEPQKVSEKVPKKTCKTIRISVILPESNEDNCPEYNYKDQVAAVKKRSKQSKESNIVVENGLDPFGEENDDDVRRIALEMEAKYGTGMTGAKKKRKGRKDDYADIGMGYDESDSFIDNTDGYDEIIPQNVTTLHGGFYINCGALEFKTDEEASSEISSNSSESEDEEKPVNRKRILDTTDESDSDTASTSQAEKKPKLQSSKNSMQQAIKKKLFSQNKIQVKKRRLIDPLKKTVKELLREKRVDLNMSVPGELKTDENEDNVEKDSLKENKKPMSITSVTDAIESVINQVGELDFDNNQSKHSADVHKKTEISAHKSDAPSSFEGESSQEARKIEKFEVVMLPENLPADILDVINRIKQAAFDYKGEGKKKFFTDEVNQCLLSLERKSKILGKSSRVKVYEHLASIIKCRKETLIRRAKILVLEDDEKRLKRLTIKLKDSIDQIMPTLKSDFEQESQRFLQKKFSKEGVENPEIQNLKMPRRRFKWTEDIKKLLKDTLSLKKRCLILEGKQKDNLEEQMSQYLKTVILPFWPEGWMYLNSLKKFFNSLAENSKSDNNNSKSSSSKHSNISITPVMNSKTTSKPDDIPKDIILNKGSINEVKITPKLVEIVPTSAAQVNNLQANPIKVPQPTKVNTAQSSRDTVKIISQPTNLVLSNSVRDINKITQQTNSLHSNGKESHKSVNFLQPPSVSRESMKIPPHPINMPSSFKDPSGKDSLKISQLINLSSHHKESAKIQSQPINLAQLSHSSNSLVSSKVRDSEKPKHHEKTHDARKLSPTDLSKHGRQNEASDSSVIVVNTTQSKDEHHVKSSLKEDRTETNTVIPKATHCQVIDLTDHSHVKSMTKADENRPFKLFNEASGSDLTKTPSSRDLISEVTKFSSNHPELSVTPSLMLTSTPKVPTKSEGEEQEVRMVMESLKALHKLSSPIKSENSTSSPVSVIAYNKSFSPKSNSSQGSGQRTDFNNKPEFAGGFQDEFQKQFINSLQHMAAAATSPTSTKPNYNRCS